MDRVRSDIRWVNVLLVFLFWLTATSYNLAKAYHIDDTAYLEVAQWITENPLRPMSGMVNWVDSPEPIHRMNQPPLHPYFLALWGKLFGYGEKAMHSLLALFSLWAILTFYRIARLTHAPSALVLTLFFSLGPAFVVGQNLMTDIPVVAYWLGFYHVLIKPEVRSEFGRILTASLFATAAVLTKYSSLPLIPILLGYTLLRRQFRLLPIAAIPVLALLGWSVFNHLEYGSIHLLDRSGTSKSLTRAIPHSFRWIICLGAISPFSTVFFSGWISRRRSEPWSAARRVLMVAAALFSALLVSFFFLESFPSGVMDTLLRNIFFLNGILLVFLVSMVLSRTLGSMRRGGEVKDCLPTVILLYWFFSGAAFIILFSPLMATRHVLLVLPAMLLILGHEYLQWPGNRHRFVSVAATVILTVVLAISDWYFADFYRTQARSIMSSMPGGQTTWYTGHWGWQWYARASGMKQLDGLLPQALPGDYLVIPRNVHRQHLHPDLVLQPVREITDPGGFLTYFSTRGPARFYVSTSRRIPWNLSREPVGTIEIYMVLENPLRGSESVPPDG